MTIFFSKTTKGFYLEGTASFASCPKDACEITKSSYLALLQKQEQGKIIQPDEYGYPVAVVPVPKLELTLDQVRTAKQREIAAAHDAFLKVQSKEYSEMERQTWDSQRTEASALLVDPQADAPLVRAIANARGMDVVEMARRIQENTQAWSVLAGGATGQRLKYQDALEAYATVEEIEAINPVFNFPEAE